MNNYQGDTFEKWNTEPFQMIEGGPIWIPPPCRDRDRTRTQVQKPRKLRLMSDRDREQLELLIHNLTVERSSILEAMGFAIDNAESAAEVVEVITESLLPQHVPAMRKVARLFLISDILFNARRLKSASVYRTLYAKANMMS